MNFHHSFFKEVLPFIRISNDQKLAVEAWWQAFEKDQLKICNLFNEISEDSFNISNWMAQHLHKIDNDIMWEFGPGLQKPYRLVLTSESNKQLRPLVQYILNKSPDLKDWEFYEYRLPEDLILTQQTMASRTNWYDIAKIEFELVQEDFNKIGIIYYVPSLLNQEAKNIYNSYILTESLLGEEILDKWIGCFEVRLKVKKRFFMKAKTSSQNIANLKKEVLRSIEEIKTRLSKDIYSKEISNKTIEWGLMKATPSEQVDYPQKQDLYISSFIVTKGDLFNAMYKDHHNFFSERFSNHNEIFVYLKIDGTSNDIDEKIFPDRTTIEDMLNEALSKEKLGCVIGGGTGLKYSYIDFALIDLDKAIQTMQKVLQESRLTKNSWFLFYDSIYESQWIGVWDDSPTPFM